MQELSMHSAINECRTEAKINNTTFFLVYIMKRFTVILSLNTATFAVREWIQVLQIRLPYLVLTLPAPIPDEEKKII